MSLHVDTPDFGRLKSGGFPEVYFPVFTPLVAALTLSILYLAARYSLPFPWIYRYLCVVPVVLAAYQHGLTTGLITAGLFSLAYVPELYVVWYWNGFSLVTLERMSFIIFLNVLAYIVAEVAATERTQELLSDAVRDSKALLARTSDFDEVIDFTLREAEELSGTHTAALLVRAPLSDEWEVVTREQTYPLHPDESSDEQQTLAQWLLQQARPVIVNDPDRDPRFVVPVDSSGGVLHSLVAQPLRRRDHSLLGMLVLLNHEDGESFTQSELRALQELVTGSERALEQAGLYAQTDRALALRVKHLSALQRTARELNATLKPEEIVEHTMVCAREITDGDVGVVHVDVTGFPTLTQTWSCTVEPETTNAIVAATRELRRPIVQTGRDVASGGISLLARPASRLLAPIRREDQTLGAIVVESGRVNAFEQATVQAIASLTDHAVIALENARLFRQTRHEKNRVNLILRSVADGLFTTDTSGRILTFNPAAEQLTGWTTEEAVGRTICDVFGCNDDQDRCNSCHLVDAIRAQRTIHDEKWVIRQRLGTKRVVSVSAAPLTETNDYADGMVVVFRDVTKKEELDRLQREFVAAFSHELRTPLTKITTIAEMLAEENADTHNGSNGVYFDVLMEQSRHLADFTEKILDVSRLDAVDDALQERPLPISLLAEETAREWETTVDTHSFSLQMPSSPLWVWADESAVQSALKNLIDNAVKYSSAGTTVSITVEQSSPDFATVAVQDEGAGIAPEHQARIFDRFYRVDGSDAQKVYGHGIGLYLSKSLIESMGGKIWVESEPDVGSRFTFSLPLIKEDTYDG